MRPPRRRSVLALLGVSAAAAVSLPLLTMAVGVGPPLPDLVSESPSLSADPEFTAEPAPGPYKDGRLLLRFDGYVTNGADADSSLEIRASGGTAANGYVMTTVQQIGGATDPGVGGALIDSGARKPVVRFENADDHDHYHLKDAAEYTLWNKDKTVQVALAQKTAAGFCLEDTLFAGGGDPKYTTGVGGNSFCWQHQPDPSAHGGEPLVMGISPGWKDLYNAGLTYQWVDVSYTPPGDYNLAARVDPQDVIRESDETNNSYKYRPYTLAGYVANPVVVPQTGTTRTVALTATKYGTPSVCAITNHVNVCSSGSRQFKILTPPQHGTLNKSPQSGAFSDSSVQYTPDPGYTGSDSFTYAAVTQGWPYPRDPQGAPVTISGTTASVAISGAPASLAVGTGAQLSAGVVGAPPSVTWSASAGTISQSGLYVAPSTVPPGGVATITAASTASPALKGSVNITILGSGTPAPAPTGLATKAPPKPFLSTLKTGHIGKRIIVGKITTGRQAGKLFFTANLGKKVVGRCTVKAPANRVVTCKIKLRQTLNLKKVRMTAQLKFGKTSIVRRAFVVK